MIYFYHIQCTGGRSLMQSILHQFPNPADVWKRCHTASEGPVVKVGDYRIAPWYPIPPSGVDLAWSHVPFDGVILPPDTFTVTVLRDPTQRFVAWYKMVRRFERMNPRPVTLQPYYQYLGANIIETAKNVPLGLRWAQVRHFSPKLDVDEAVEHITALSYYFRLERFEAGLEHLRKAWGLALPHLRIRDTHETPRVEQLIQKELKQPQLVELRKLLDLEYQLMGRLRWEN